MPHGPYDPLEFVQKAYGWGEPGPLERPRHIPSDVPVSSSGRWGPRRVHVGQCAAILPAELVYERLICDRESFGPGSVLALSWAPEGASGRRWTLEAEILSNAVWRRGRLFFRCPRCERRATRLYVPVVGLEPRCRRCWGLNYESHPGATSRRDFWGHCWVQLPIKRRRHAARNGGKQHGRATPSGGSFCEQ